MGSSDLTCQRTLVGQLSCSDPLFIRAYSFIISFAVIQNWLSSPSSGWNLDEEQFQVVTGMLPSEVHFCPQTRGEAACGGGKHLLGRGANKFFALAAEFRGQIMIVQPGIEVRLRLLFRQIESRMFMVYQVGNSSGASRALTKSSHASTGKSLCKRFAGDT